MSDYVFAQAQNSTGVTTNTQVEQNNVTRAAVTIDTFHIDGAIASLSTDLLNPQAVRQNVTDPSQLPIYILAGNWSMDVANGQANSFQIDLIMALRNGKQIHVYSVGNLRNVVIAPTSRAAERQAESIPPSPEAPSTNNLILSPANNYSLSLFGSVDVQTNATTVWKDVPTSIDVLMETQ